MNLYVVFYIILLMLLATNGSYVNNYKIGNCQSGCWIPSPILVHLLFISFNSVNGCWWTILEIQLTICHTNHLTPILVNLLFYVSQMLVNLVFIVQLSCSILRYFCHFDFTDCPLQYNLITACWPYKQAHIG